MADLSQDQSLKSNPNTNPPGQGQPSQGPKLTPTPLTPSTTPPSSTPLASTNSTSDSSFPPIKEEEKFATPKQEEIKKELSELGISPKGGSKKTRVLLATLGVFFLIATLPAAVYLVRQRQELKTEAAYLPGCTANCDIEVGPGKYGFVAGGHGMRDVKMATINLNLPAETQGYEAYAIWSGESNRDEPNYNDTSIRINGHDVNAIKTYQITNPNYNTSQIANIGKIQNSAIKDKTGTVSFNVAGLDNLNSDDHPGGGHGIGIIAIYTGENVSWNKITIKLWGEWLYKTYPAFAQGQVGNKSAVMQFELSGLDANRKNDNQFAFFFGEGEKRYDSCQDSDGRSRPSHLFYKTESDWIKLDANTGINSQPWPACPLPENKQPGQWWATRVTGKDLPAISLTGNNIHFTADSLVREEGGSFGDSYTFVGAVAQYPVEQPTYDCWSECNEQSQCQPAGYVCAIPTSDTSQTKRCLNSQCPIEETCVCAPPLCISLTASPSAETLGEDEEVQFICKGTAGTDESIDRIEFKVQLNSEWQDPVVAENITESEGEYEGKIIYTIPETGDYQVQCRVCTTSEQMTCDDQDCTGSTSIKCTEWGKAAVEESS